ncbi:hypothetical protein Hanom_Chr08g00737941 [Helianthus anomalus]
MNGAVGRAAGHKQENINLKAANVALVKEKAAAVAVLKYAEARREDAVKALEEANLGRARMTKSIEEAKTSYATLEVDSRKELETREEIVADVNQRLVEAATRATKVAEEKDDLANMNANLVADRIWMRNCGVVNYTDADAEVVGHAREAGYKAGYTECLAHVKAISAK